MSAAAIKAGKAFVEITARDEQLKRTLKEDGARMKAFAMQAAAIGATAIVAAGAAGIAAASNLEETLNKFNVVFGENSAAIKKWGDDFAQEVGRSQRQVAEFMANTQDLLIPIGFEQGEAEQLSKDLTRLAVDVASFNNKADADVLRDFQSALTGGGETVKKYGVVLNVAAIKQKLLENSIDPGTATAAQKAWASYQIILESTTAAQGDAVRSGDSFANQMKRFQGNVEDTAAALGSALLPAATQLLQITNAVIVPMAQWLSDNTALVETTIKMAAAIGAVIVVMKAMTLASQAYAKAQAVALALTGPEGWAKLAVAAGVAAVAIAGVNVAMADANDTLAEVDDALAGTTDGMNAQADAADKLAGAMDNAADGHERFDNLINNMQASTAAVTDLMDKEKSSAEKLADSLKVLADHRERANNLAKNYEGSEVNSAVRESFSDDELKEIRASLIEAATGFGAEIKRIQNETGKLNGTLTDTDILLAKMAEKGLPVEEMQQLRAAMEGLDAARKSAEQRKADDQQKKEAERDQQQRRDELTARADEIRDALKTPAEHFADMVREMQELVKAGVLDRDTAREYLARQQKQARGELDARNQQQDRSITQSASLDLRSAEGAALINRLLNPTNSKDDRIAKATSDTAKYTKQMAQKTSKTAKV